MASLRRQPTTVNLLQVSGMASSGDCVAQLKYAWMMDLTSNTRPPSAVSAVEPTAMAAPLARTTMPADLGDAAPGDASDDGALMLRYRDGDVAAFETLYERHKGALYRYLNRMCRNREIAEDLFQEVWGRVIASRDRYEARAQFTTFLFRVAHNAAIDYFRRAEHRHMAHSVEVDCTAEQLPGAAADRPDAQASESQLRTAFRRALEQLPAEQRDVFLLYEESGLSLEQIGAVTGVAMETAKSRLRYAVGKLRAALQQHQTPLYQSSVES